MVELHTNHGVIKLGARRREGTEDGRELPELREEGPLRRHRVPSRDQRLHDPGGGFEPGLKQKPTDAPIDNEANNGLKNDNYTVAMARTNDPHSATAQFFINVNDNDFLNHSSPTPQGWGYAVFGKSSKAKGRGRQDQGRQDGQRWFHQDVPTDDVVIEKAVVV